MADITTAAEARQAGWVEYIAESRHGDPSVPDQRVAVPPDAVLTESIDVFSHEEGKIVRMNGWNWFFTPAN